MVTVPTISNDPTTNEGRNTTNTPPGLSSRSRNASLWPVDGY